MYTIFSSTELELSGFMYSKLFLFIFSFKKKSI